MFSNETIQRSRMTSATCFGQGRQVGLSRAVS
jgi:hypothetical protein